MTIIEMEEQMQRMQTQIDQLADKQENMLRDRPGFLQRLRDTPTRSEIENLLAHLADGLGLGVSNHIRTLLALPIVPRECFMFCEPSKEEKASEEKD